MKVKRIGITEILRRIWLFFANKEKSSESGSKKPTQLIVELNISLWHIIVTQAMIWPCVTSMQIAASSVISLLSRTK